MNAIKPALDAYKPALTATYVRQLTDRIDYIILHFGPSMKGVYNSRYGQTWKELKSLCVHTPSDDSWGSWTVDAERVAKAAGEYALATIETWHAKIEAKMGQLESATVHSLSGFSFNIVGTKAGRRVSIRQTMTINVSPKGKPFNQFPARIYVNGKFTPEAQFKKLT